jgi:hypothetical protein
LLEFDGLPLFPEPIAYASPYKLSDAEARLDKEVTDSVCQKFSWAEALEDDKRRARSASRLAILQRRVPRRRRRSTSRSATGASAWRSDCASWSFCRAAPRFSRPCWRARAVPVAPAALRA